MGIQAAVIGKVLAGKGRSRLVSGKKVIPLSSSERDEVLKVLSP